MTTTVTVKRVKQSYWAGDVEVRVGDLLAADDPKVVAIYVEDLIVTTVA